jgi:hypothetical protein
MTTTTLTLTNGSVTLSGGNLIATSSSGTGAAGSADAFRVPSSRLVYFEYAFNVRASANTSAGFGPVGQAYTAFNVAPNSEVLLQSAGGLYESGAAVLAFGALVNGDVICFAIDLNHGLYWVRKNTGSWNTSATADPVAGTGGRSIPFSYIAPVINLGATSEQVTANFGGSAFAQTVPSGFTSGWASPGDTTALLQSQVGIEAYYQDNATGTLMQVSQIGIEVFRSTADAFSSALITSQLGIEVWRSTRNGAPATAAAMLCGL